MANDGDKCPKCGRGILEIKPAGISKKSKKPYGAFLYCPVRPCDFTDWLPDDHPANRKSPDPVVPASQLTTAAPPAASSAPAPTTGGIMPVADVNFLSPPYRPPTGYDAVSEAINAVCRIEGDVVDRVALAKEFAEMLKSELGPTAAPAWPDKPSPPGEDDDIPF